MTPATALYMAVKRGGLTFLAALPPAKVATPQLRPVRIAAYTASCTRLG